MTTAQHPSIIIRRAVPSDLGALWALSHELRQSKSNDYFEKNFAEQNLGYRELFIAAYDGENAGYCILNWDPKYAYFRSHNIPETQDLNVLSKFRRRGIATALIHHCEELARTRGKKTMGISVGLNASFGPAQKLYVKMGYIPDGHGVTYDRRSVGAGAFHPVDENLCLMMEKNL
jgi:GNAT superfamily N-acetyltransferase